MIRIFYGDDRVRAGCEIAKLLGSDYEVLDGATLDPADMVNVFMGMSLLVPERKILIKDLALNKAAYEKLPEFLDTPHEVILLETKIDKRSAVYKAVKDRVELREFALLANRNVGVVFDVYKTAKRDGVKAVRMLERIEAEQEPLMFFGLVVSQAIKDFVAKQGAEEKRVLRLLSDADMQLKSSGVEPWLIIKALLLEIEIKK